MSDDYVFPSFHEYFIPVVHRYNFPVSRDVKTQTDAISSYPIPLKLKPKPNEEKDITAKIIGDFGRWQLLISILMSTLKLPTAWYQLNIIFMAPPQDFWCKKPELFSSYSDEEWRKMCKPNVEEYPCLIFDPDLLFAVPRIDKTVIPLVVCKEFVHDTSMFPRTIVSDWDLVCSKRYLVHLCQVVLMWGILLGGILFGIVADKRGRRMPLLVGIAMQGIASFFASVIPWFWVFLFNWFLLALANGGIGVISFVICMEVVSGKWRTIIPVVYQLPFGLGNAVMAVLAYWLRDWRKLEFALAFLSSLFMFYWFCLPESPRWLIATGRTHEAFAVLQKVAKMNRRPFNRKRVKLILSKYSNPVHHKKEPGFFAYLKSKNMRKKTILLSMNWFCTGLAFYTFAQYLGSMGDNVFKTVAVTGVISAIGGLSCVFVVTKVGRKITICIYQAITTACFLLIQMVPKNSDWESDWVRLLFAGIGFAGMAGTVPALYLFSGELYPTVGRNVGVSGVSTFARVASMIAPFVVALDKVFIDLPLVILALISYSQILMILPLPETKDVPLPDTLEEAEKI